MEIGQRFYPYKQFFGCFIPDCLMSYKGLSSSAKLVWGLLAQYTVKNGASRPASVFQQSLADGCAISRRQCWECLKELQRQGFIEINGEARKKQQYFFLWHPIFEEERRNLSDAKTASVTPQSYEETAPVGSTDEEIAPVENPEPETDAKTAPDESSENQTGAVSSHQLMQKLHISGAKTAHKENLDKHENLSSSSEYIPSDILENTRAPDEEDETDEAKAVKLLSSLLAGTARDYHFQQLYDLWEDFSHELILDTLKDMQARGIQHSGVLPYLRKTVKDQDQKQKAGLTNGTNGFGNRKKFSGKRNAFSGRF